jgi:hypothetical protein
MELLCKASGRVVMKAGIAAALWLCSSQGAAQGPPRCSGAQLGQWLGPWDLETEINGGVGATPPRFSEITHAMLLPPPNDGWVLFWCARYCGDVDGVAIPQYQTFLWHQDNQSSVLHVAMPAVSPDPEGSADMFCGTQTFSADGDPVIFGGTDLPTTCADSGHLLHGHKKVWLFQNANSLREWVSNPTNMLRERWYGSAILLPDGRILVTANAALPFGESPVTGSTREHGTVELDSVGTPFVNWDTNSATKNFVNWRLIANCDKDLAPDSGIVDLPGYAQLHVLLGGNVLCVGIGRPGFQDTHSAVLDFNACPTDEDEEVERWIVGPDLSISLQPQLEGSPSLHVVNAATNHEWVWSISGGEVADDCDDDPTETVLLLEDPDATTEWEADAALNVGRLSSNAVLGSDGALFVLGGLDDACAAALEPERYRPPQVFSTGNTTTWELMCPEEYQRAYHSWALLLPDGSILSGGGIGCPPGDCFGPSSQSLEVYKPPYLFQGGRPDIVDWPDPLPSPHVDEPFSLQVVLPAHTSTGGEFRVALLQPGAVTHAFNTNQRYVVLAHDSVTMSTYPNPTTVAVTIPNRNATPPGWYMLVVVSSAGVPSSAKWLKILPPLT